MFLSGSKRKKKAVDGFESAFEKQQARSRYIDGNNSRAFIKKESDVQTTAGANNCSNSENPNTEFQQSTNKTKAKRRKCRRQFSWQRSVKRRQLNIQESNTVVPGIEINTEREILSATSQPSEKVLFLENCGQKLLLHFPSEIKEFNIILETEGELNLGKK